MEPLKIVVAQTYESGLNEFRDTFEDDRAVEARYFQMPQEAIRHVASHKTDIFVMGQRFYGTPGVDDGGLGKVLEYLFDKQEHQTQYGDLMTETI